MTWLNHLGLGFMRLIAPLPLPVVRRLGWLLGHVLYLLAWPRRRIAHTNWALCFPEQSASERRRAVRQHFVYFGQAWLDRSWLWEGSPHTARQRLQLSGHVEALHSGSATVIFAPHFVGMDAGWTALTAHVSRRFCGMYAAQRNATISDWMVQGRQRFGAPHIVSRHQGVRSLAAALRAGEPLYLLPDMDYGREDSVFVPFFGVPAATITSLPRFARLGRAQVVPVVSRLTPSGYDVVVHAPWTHYPSDDVLADTAEMNKQLQALITTMPSQYYWVHKRFKTRPEGQASVYRS